MCLVCSVHSTRSSGSHCTGTALQQPYDHTVYSQQCLIARQTNKAVRAAACYIDLMRGNLAWAAETNSCTPSPRQLCMSCSREEGQKQQLPSSGIYQHPHHDSTKAELLLLPFPLAYFLFSLARPYMMLNYIHRKECLEKMKNIHILIFCQWPLPSYKLPQRKFIELSNITSTYEYNYFHSFNFILQQLVWSTCRGTILYSSYFLT